MPRVPRPAIAEFLHPSEGNRPTSAPQNLVEELEVEHESDLIDMIVLSFWTERHQNLPIRYCLSPPAAARLARRLDQAVENYLHGPPPEIE